MIINVFKITNEINSYDNLLHRRHYNKSHKKRNGTGSVTNQSHRDHDMI